MMPDKLTSVSDGEIKADKAGVISVYMAFYQKVQRKVVEVSLGTKFRHDDNHARVLLSYHATIIEFGEAVICLIRSGHSSSATILLRAMLDAYVDMAATYKDARYTIHRELESHSKSLLVLKCARDEKNPFLEYLSNDPTLDQKISEKAHKIDLLKLAGARKIKAYERFKLADVEQMYFPIYGLLSAAAHSDLTELGKRHLEKDDQGREFLTFFKEAIPEESILLLDTGIGLLIRSTIQIAHLLASDEMRQSIAALENEFLRFRQDP